MKNRKRVIMGIALLLGASLLVLFVFGAQIVLKIHQKRFKKFGVVKEENFTNTVYYKTCKMSYAEWNQLKTELVSEGWHPIEPKIELVSPLLVSEDEFQHTTECFSKYRKIYYTIIPKACTERIVVMEFEDYVLIHLMIAVYKPWGKEAF